MGGTKRSLIEHPGFPRYPRLLNKIVIENEQLGDMKLPYPRARHAFTVSLTQWTPPSDNFILDGIFSSSGQANLVNVSTEAMNG